MRFLSRLAELCGGVTYKAESTPVVNYDSAKVVQSTVLPGVRFAVQRMSFGRRLDLCHRIREIAPRLEFLEAGNEFDEKVEANLLGQEIENLYLRWGLIGVEGIRIDGEVPTAEVLIAKGPEPFAKEIVAAIQAECGLTEEERKN
jgi:hypothetical protein